MIQNHLRSWYHNGLTRLSMGPMLLVPIILSGRFEATIGNGSSVCGSLDSKSCGSGTAICYCRLALRKLNRVVMP